MVFVGIKFISLPFLLSREVERKSLKPLRRDHNWDYFTCKSMGNYIDSLEQL